MTAIVSVDQLCTGLEDILKQHLAPTMTQLGWEDHGPVKTWQQVPSVAALASAQFPAIAVVAGPLIGTPTLKRSADAWSATWEIGVGIYTRGRDHHQVQARVRNWCAGIRTTVVRRKSLGGLATGLIWSGEQYAALPGSRNEGRDQARSIGAGAVGFNVTADVLIDPTDLAGGDLPLVTSTPTTLSVQ